MAKYFMVFDSHGLGEVKQVKANIYALAAGSKPDYLFTDLNEATKFAEKKASERPGSLIVVLHGVDVFEAGKAPIIRKKFNEEGEIVPR